MRVLFLADHELWPPTSGAAQRAFHLATGLAARHDVALVVLHWWNGDVTDFPGAAAFAEIHAVPYGSCRFAAAGRLQPEIPLGRSLRPSLVPDSVRRYESAQLGDVLSSVGPRRFDAAWVTRGYFAEQAAACGHRRVVVDLPDLETELQRRRATHATGRRARVGAALESVRTARWERHLPRRFAAVTVCKEADVELFARAPNVHVVANGVTPRQPADRALERTDEILFVGTLHYEPNVDAVWRFHDRILPLIRRVRPSTRFVVAGHHPAPAVLALHDGDRCVVHGDVPDLTGHYARAGVVVVPVRLGAGTRIKSIEALAYGKAVVSTTLGMDGVDARPGVDFVLADTDECFADACIRLLGDAALRRRLGTAGRERMAERHVWGGAVDAADRALTSVR